MGSERGIAMIWWVIVLLVLFLAAAGLAFDRYSDGVEKQKTIDEQKVEIKNVERKSREEIQKRVELSGLIGFKPDEGSQESDPESIRSAIDTFKNQFQDPSQDAVDTTLQQILMRAVQKYGIIARRLADAEAARDTARSNEDAARETANSISAQKDTRIGELENEKQQVEDRLDNLTKTKDQDIEGLRGKVSTLQQEKGDLENSHKKVVKGLETERDRERNLAKDASNRDIRIKKNNKEDGKILQRQTDGNKVWINLGFTHGLKEGIQFEVFDYVKGNVIRPKGNLVIQEVHKGYSIAALTNEVFEFDPVVVGDLIRNPLFEKGKQPVFFLMGDMTGVLSNQETVRLIGKNGGKVATKLTANVDFVVVGRKESENATPLENRPEWENAKTFKIEFISSKDLIKYLTK